MVQERRILIVIAVVLAMGLGTLKAVQAACYKKANLTHSIIGQDYNYQFECPPNSQPCGNRIYFEINIGMINCMTGAANQKCAWNPVAVRSYVKDTMCHPSGACVTKPGSEITTAWTSRNDTLPCP